MKSGEAKGSEGNKSLGATAVHEELKEFEVTLNRTQRKLNLLCSWLHLKFGDDISFPRSLYHEDATQDEYRDILSNTEPEEILSDPLPDNSPEFYDYHEEVITEYPIRVVHPGILADVSPRPRPGLGSKTSKNTETNKNKSPSTPKKITVDHVTLAPPPAPLSSGVEGSLQKADFNVPPTAGAGNPRTTTRFVRLLPRPGEEEDEDGDGGGKKRLLKLAEVLPQLKSRNVVLVPANQMHKLTKSSISTCSFGRKQSTVLMPPKNPQCITIDDDDDDVPAGVPEVADTATPSSSRSVGESGSQEGHADDVADVLLSLCKKRKTPPSSLLSSSLPTKKSVKANDQDDAGPNIKKAKAVPTQNSSVDPTQPGISFKCKFCRSSFPEKRRLSNHVVNFHPDRATPLT